MFTNPVQFYDFFLNRVVVTFRPKFEDATPENEFSIILSKKNTYEQVRPQLHSFLSRSLELTGLSPNPFFD